MPKTTKEVNDKKNLISKTTSKTTKKSTNKAAAKKTKSNGSAKSTTVKKASTAKKGTTSATKKASTAKKTTSVTRKSPTTKKEKAVSSKKASFTAKTTTKKATDSNKKVVSRKKTPSKKQTNKINVLEYYDLPYRYNQTVVKMLAQTPKTLFVYWDISDIDRENYIKQYGNDFFEKTKPVLIIHNTTMNYTFEIDINDFANCWYFDINDEKCEYSVELGRRPKENNINIPNDYLYITSSNKIESPNGHILFEKNQKTIFFRNVKTNQTYSKEFASFEFMKYLGRIYNLHDMYKKIYKENEILNIDNPTSTFK